jgi:hypothetical protein
MKGTASQPNYKSRHGKTQAQRAGRGANRRPKASGIEAERPRPPGARGAARRARRRYAGTHDQHRPTSSATAKVTEVNPIQVNPTRHDHRLQHLAHRLGVPHPVSPGRLRLERHPARHWPHPRTRNRDPCGRSTRPGQRRRRRRADAGEALPLPCARSTAHRAPWGTPPMPRFRNWCP